MTLQQITLQKITEIYTQQEFIANLKLLYLRTDVSNYPLIDIMVTYYDTMFEITMDCEGDVIIYSTICLECVAFLDELHINGCHIGFCNFLSGIILFGIEWVNGIRKIS